MTRFGQKQSFAYHFSRSSECTMSRIEIPANLIDNIGSELKMDFHAVDVRLTDGRFFKGLVVKGGRYITGREADQNGEGQLPFRTDDIAKVRPTARFLGSLWPFWPGPL